MSNLADPRICPDCRAQLDARLTCTGCGLSLQGPAAVSLWEHLQQADLLIEHLRIAAPASPTAPAPVPAPVPAPSMTAGLPVAPPLPGRPAPQRGSRLTVPVVLLGLGGICVLVAAIVFVAVTWSSLGLAGRTVIMVGVTALATAAAALLTRRGLRGGAETLWLVTHVLIAIDVAAAAGADLAGLGDLGPRTLVGGLGLLLLTSALGVATWARSTAVPRLLGLVAVTVAGAALTTAAAGWAAESSVAGTALSLPVLAALTVLVARVRDGGLRPHAYGVAAVGAASWLVLVGQGLDRYDGVTATVWWQDFRGWPLLVAALVAAIAALPRSVPELARSFAAGASLVCLTFLALGGDASDGTKVWVGSAVAAALAAVSGLGPRVWSRPAALLTGIAVLVTVPATLLRSFGVTDELPGSAPGDGAGLDLRLPPSTWELPSWTAVVIAVVAAVSLLGLVRHLPERARPAGYSAWASAAPVLLGLGLVSWFLESGPRLLPAAAAWAALLVLAGVLTLRSGARDGALAACLALDAYLVLAGLRLATPSHLLVALLATLVAVALALGAWRAVPTRLGGSLAAVLSGGSALLLFLAAAHWPYLLGGTGDAAGLTLALVAAAVGLAAERAGRTPAARITLETAALLSGLVGTALAVGAAYDTAVLTVVGSAVALVSVLHPDRDRASWIGSGILALAVIVRVGEGTAAPELVALPAAALLVAAGIHRLRTDPAASSWRALASGLTLGLLPSLVGTLDDPVSVRGALVGAAGLAVLALGVQRRWAAPFWAGAVVVGLVAVQHLWPVAAALPRWISLGSVGIVLLGVGITWEARRRDATKAEKYLVALR